MSFLILVEPKGPETFSPLNWRHENVKCCFRDFPILHHFAPSVFLCLCFFSLSSKINALPDIMKQERMKAKKNNSIQSQCKRFIYPQAPPVSLTLYSYPVAHSPAEECCQATPGPSLHLCWCFYLQGPFTCALNPTRKPSCHFFF